MGAVTTADQIVREDLSNLYINIDKRRAGFVNRMAKGEDLKNVKFFSWAIERYDGRLISGVTENKDADNFETDLQQQLYGRSQKFWRQPHVTVEANTVNKAPADFGKYNKQVVKKVEEQRRDIEQRLLADADSRDDDGLTGREVQGIGRFVNDATSVGSAGAALTFGDTQTTVPVALRTPTAQIYVGHLYSTNASTGDRLDFTIDSLNGMLQNRFDAYGRTNQLSCFCDALFRRHMTRLLSNQKTLNGFTPITRIPSETVAMGDYIASGSDMVHTDFGPMDITLLNWLPRASDGTLSGRAYFLDMEFIQLRASGLYLTHQQLEDRGAGPRGLIQSILGPQWGDPGAHLKVDPATAVGTY